MRVNLLGIPAKTCLCIFVNLGQWQWYDRHGHGVPVFEGSKNGVAWILTSCVME